MNNIVRYVLVIVFFIIYIMIANFIWNQFVIVDSSLGVLVGSLLAILIAIVLSIITVNKVVVVLQTRNQS
ncbi:hypothetical protein LGQ02_01415 [Bacillus shivajii]|uniref:hypothetical protein n=1 Tax=Bacillus shivajii TaxID=1983719 RepID=UPI001CFB5EA5|nr:hypothetical protein [Bacillus shivajii]UCZ53488.1 hypothetical protein LGQ02_01415 [Bacillus shivajii]